jgi:tetratricopeptide (TPR) repeat protein
MTMKQHALYVLLNLTLLSMASFVPESSVKNIYSISIYKRKMALSVIESPRTLIGEGTTAFRRGNIQESIQYFDRADQAVPDGSLRPYLWQRGISYYYNDEFEKASRQFRNDVQVNPLVVEEIVWDIASLSRLCKSKILPSEMMSLPKGQRDRRKIMSVVYALFRGEATEQQLASAGHGSGSPADEFYSLFYLGLYCESIGEVAKAENYMKAATTTVYANQSGAGDYMTACAKIHCQLRGWI